MSRRESKVPMLAAFGLLVALAALLWWRTSAGTDGEAPAPDATVEAEAPEDGDGQAGAENGPDAALGGVGGRSVTLWFDGWSHRTVGGPESLLVLADSATGAQLARVEPVLSPASIEDLQLLSARDPFLVSDLVARMVRFDVELACTADGCSSQRGDVPLDWLAAPTASPALGEMFSAWQVEHGVWTATFRVPEETASLRVGVPGWSPARLVLPSAGEFAGGVPEDASEDTSEDAAEDASEDTSEDAAEDAAGVAPAADLAVSAAFGTMFQLTPNWIVPSGVWAAQPFAIAPSALPAPTPDAVDPVWSEPGLLWRGLADRSTPLSGLSPSLLTMLSSPSIGCNGALCVPDVVEAEVVVVEEVFFALACPHPEFPERSGLYPPDGSALAVVHQFELSLTLDGPVPQLGLPGLPPVEEWAGHVEGGSGPFTGDVPLSSGTVSVPVQQVWLMVAPEGDGAEPLVVRFRRPGAEELPLSPSSWHEPWWQLTPCVR